MRTDSSQNEVPDKCLKTLFQSYSTGTFEKLFPLLAENCVFESQWVLMPNTGEAQRASIGLRHPDGKLTMLMWLNLHYMI